MAACKTYKSFVWSGKLGPIAHQSQPLHCEALTLTNPLCFFLPQLLNQTKWVRLTKKGWGILNPFPHHPCKNKDKGESLHWPSTDEPCHESCPLGPGCPKEDGFGLGAFIRQSAMALGSAHSVSQTTHTGKSEYLKQERKALMLAE